MEVIFHLELTVSEQHSSRVIVFLFFTSVFFCVNVKTVLKISQHEHFNTVDCKNFIKFFIRKTLFSARPVSRFFSAFIFYQINCFVHYNLYEVNLSYFLQKKKQ